MFTRRLFPLSAIVLLATLGFAGSNPDPQAKPSQQPMSRETRMMVIRSLSAEFVFVHHALPMGTKGITIKDKQIVSPSEEELKALLATYGPAAKPGDRAQITNVEFKDNNRIVFEINGGQKKKGKWYQHVQVGVGGGMVGGPDDTKNPRGSVVELRFDKFVPELTGDQVREMLSPVFDFKSKSAAEAYIETVPPKVKEAIKNHEVLVGMNREMVGFAKGRPEKKIRELDDSGNAYEEWLYGHPPDPTEFVRFVGDEVVRLEIMKVDGQKVLRTEKEVDLTPQREAKQEQERKEAAAKAEATEHPVKRPTLRRPGEPAPPDAPLPKGGVQQPDPVTQPSNVPPGVPQTTPPAPPGR